MPNTMYSSNKGDRLMWQHPFVNIFKQFKVDDWKKSSKEGDVSAVVDKQIKSTVYKIQGSVPAGNYIQFPRTTSQSLGLTGRYLNILFKPIPTKYFVVHLDTVTDDGLVVRISFSNLFKEFKSTATWLQFPFACHAAKGSVEHFASLGARQDFMGPAPLAQKWTLLVLDLHYILSIYMNRKFASLKNIRLCANMLVKNCFTTDICYDPRLSVRQARIVGIKSADENFAPMPREMNFFLPKDKEWDDLYDVVRFPVDTPRTENRLPFDSIQRDDEDFRETLFQSRNSKSAKKSSTLKTGVGVIKSPRRDRSKVVDLSRSHKILSSTNNMAVSTRPPPEALKKKPKIVSELPPVDLSLVEPMNVSCSDPDAIVAETDSGEVHVFTGESSERDIVVHRHYPDMASGRSSVVSTRVRSQRTTLSGRGSATNRSTFYQPSLDFGKPPDGLTSLGPEPILKLDRLLGFGSHTNSYQSLSLWHTQSSPEGGKDIVIYAAHAIVVAMETSSSRQHFFIGHNDAVTCVTSNSPRASNSHFILASGQRGSGAVIRIWRFETRKCAAVIRCQHAHGMNALSFSTTGAVLVGTGRDSHGKTLFMVWNTSAALRTGSVSVIAKANTDVEISRVFVCPTDDSRMVSCGRDNIRFWRVRSNQLRSCPAVLPSEQKLEEITDIKFAASGFISTKNRPDPDCEGGLSVFACTKAGFIIEVDFQKVTIRNLHQLFPTGSKDRSKGLPLNSLQFSGSYLATGSDDGLLRLWPLDLSSVFLEVEHEGGVTDIQMSPDGAKVLAATSIGALGYLDISTRKYSTLMRSHTNMIRDCSMDGLRRSLCTCSDDRTIRVWDVDSMRQSYDFATPDDPPRVVSCHPLLEIFACGFASGSVRIFHVPKTSVLHEHTSTGVKITSLLFALTGQRLIAADAKGNLVLYDTSDIEHMGAPLLRTLLKVAAPDNDLGPHALVASSDDRKVAFVGPNDFTVTVAASSNLDELLRVDVSTGYKQEPDLLNRRPKVDSPLRLAFSGDKLNHLLVLTRACRLLKLDATSGKLLSTTEDIHRSKPTALCVSDDNLHFITAGDKIVKVWGYQMTRDINFQAFIGHSNPIHTILLTPDRLKVITVGEDCVLMWNLLRDSDQTIAEEQHEMVVIGRGSERPPHSGRRDEKVTSDAEVPKSPEDCPRPALPPTPHRGINNQSSWAPPDTLHTADLDASHVSEFTVDAKLMEKLSREKDAPQTASEDRLPDKMDRLRISLSEQNKSSRISALDASGSVPVKVAWDKRPKIDLSCIDPPPGSPPCPVLPAEKPNVLSHYSASVSASQPPQRTYAAPPGEEGLTLNSVIGYNGNGRGNLAWNPDLGLLAYTSGAIVILEKLSANQKHSLVGHSEEVSCLAMQHDGRIIASASACNGLVQSKICLWDTSALTCRATLKHHDYDVIDLAYSRDDRFLVSLGDYRECSVVLWSAFDGHSSPVVVASARTPSPMLKVVWNPHQANEFVSVGCGASASFWLVDEQQRKVTLNLFEAEAPDEITTNETDQRPIDFTSACFSDNNVLYVGASNGVVCAWDATTNLCFLHWRADSAEITCMKACGARLLVAGASRGVRLWSTEESAVSRCSHDGSVNFSLESEMSLNAPIISAAFDETLDVGIVGTTGSTLWYLDWTARTTVRMVTGHSGEITDVAFDEGLYFATSTDLGSIKLWNMSNFELAVQFQVIDYPCCCLTFSHHKKLKIPSIPVQPKMLAAGYQDGTLRVFDLDKMVLKLKLQPHSTAATAVEFSWDNNTLLSGARDGIVAATSIATGVTLRVLKDHRGANINNIATSLRLDHPASLVVREGVEDYETPCLSLICAGDRRVSVWDTDWKHDVCEMIDWLTFPAPCFAPDGSKLPKQTKSSPHLPPSVCLFHPKNPDLLLYCGYGMDKSIQQYSLTQRKVVKSTPIPNWSLSLDLSPHGRLIAIGTETRLVELIDSNHGTFQDFTGHSSEVKKVRFSPDGKYLLTSAKNELFIWNVKN